jgi:hypothetical protein
MVFKNMDIVGYEGLYKIYDDGRVFSVRRNKFLKPCAVMGGYLQVGLWKNRKGKSLHIHSLVATHFIGERPIGFHIDHKDRDKLNNKVNNLRYISRSENEKNKYVLGKIPYRHIHKMPNGFTIQITQNGKIILNNSSRNWTLEDAIKVRNEAYERLGIEIDDRVAPV